MKIKNYLVWLSVLSMILLFSSSIYAQVHEVPNLTEMVAYLNADTHCNR